MMISFLGVWTDRQTDTVLESVIYLDVYFYKFVLVYCLFNIMLIFNVY